MKEGKEQFNIYNRIVVGKWYPQDTTDYFFYTYSQPSSGQEVFNTSIHLCPHMLEGRMKRIDLVYGHEASIFPLLYVVSFHISER